MKRIICIFLLINLFAIGDDIYIGDTIIDSNNKQDFQPTKDVYEIYKEGTDSNVGRSLSLLLDDFPSTSNTGEYSNIKGDSHYKIVIDDISSDLYDLHYLDTLSMLNIEKIKIISGAGSVLYGNDSIGGVVLVNTFSPLTLENNLLFYTDSSSNDSLELTASTPIFNEKLIFKTKFINRSEEDSSLKITTSYNLNPYEYFSLNYSMIDNDKYEIGEDTTTAHENKYSFSYVNKYDSSFHYSLKLNYDDISIDKTSESLTEIIIKPEIIYNYSFASSLLLGYDLNLTEGRNKKENSQSVYLLNTYALDLYDIVSGVRSDMTEGSLNGENFVYKNYAFDLGIKYYYAIEGNIYANLSSAYKRPGLDELEANSDLVNQNSYYLDIGLITHRDNFIHNFNIFFTQTHDKIYYDTDSNLYQNLDGQVNKFGIKLVTEVLFDKLNIREALAVINTDISGGTYDGKQEPGSSNFYYKLNFSYTPFNSLELWSNMNIYSPFYEKNDYANTGNRIDSYSLFNMGINYDYNNLNFFGGIDNISDVQRDFLEEKRGRRYYIGVKAQF